MKEFHDGLPNYHPSDNVKHYFGVPDSGGISNTRISDNINALCSLTDDVIEFSRRLCKDLEKQGRQLKKKMKVKLPNVNETDFRIAEEKGLMPDPLKYRQWDDDMYNRRKPTQFQRLWAFLTRSRST